jgi:hypothetical protein
MSLALDRWDQLGIGASLSAHGFVRRSPWRDGGRSGHREWLHFTVHGGELTVVINASFVDDLRPAAPPHRERVRLLVLARDARGWHGGVDDVAGAVVRGGQLDALLGDVAIAASGAEISLRGRLRDAPIELDLVLRAQTFPSLASGVSIGDGPPIHWLVVPRLLATGRAVIAGRAYAFDDAPAYHDHNWGFFSQRDFAWQWGHDAGTGPHCVVLTRLLDGAHATAFLQALLVWRGARQVRVFRGNELRVEPEGFLRPERPFTVPRTAALLVDRLATEVPRRLHIAAAADGDAIDGAFEAHSLARIVVPHDDSLATTAIHEVEGHLRLAGTLHGAAFAVDAPAIFEFLRGVA